MKTLLTILLILSVTSIFSQEVLTGTATKVYDGDTFTLVTPAGENIKIRVVGIDAPEKNQEHGIKARDFAQTLIDQKKVTVYLEPGETYGRKLGVVITSDGKHFNYEMVKNGHAWHYERYNTDKFLSAAQEQAQKNMLGLWVNKNPIAPWDWRRNNN